MSVKISKIDIRNFRSARNVSITPSDFSIFVGKNDSGKSNILRALNLFFNDRTASDQNLNFTIDHNVFNNPNRKAKEISVKLEIDLPDSYRVNNGDFIIWERRWRAEGLVFDEYYGARRRTGPRGAKGIDRVKISNKSNVHTLLRNINYVYVPAIKDPNYFSKLRASIYAIIAEVSESEIRGSSRDFEISISRQLDDLTSSIDRSLAIKSRLALPKDLSHIFESLDFLSEGNDISLDARGDGIKSRHIPLILKFMADKKHSLQTQGFPPYSYIWGYEEPENNLELSSCIELSDQFCDFIGNGVSQIFLTTHSPVFYNLHRKNTDGQNSISCHHIFRDDDEVGTKNTAELDDLDDRMGTTALFAPLIIELEENIRQRERTQAVALELAKTNKRKIFVEGISDQIIIKKALSVFSPEKADEIEVETVRRAGTNYVIDMLLAWRSMAKHMQDTKKVVGLVDGDAIDRCKEWNKGKNNTNSAKCFVLENGSEGVQHALDAGFMLPMVLESLYDKETWTYADDNGHLIERDLIKVIHPDLNKQILKNETTLDGNLNDGWEIYVKKEFSQDGKVPIAQYIADKTDDDFRNCMGCINPLIDDIIGYLFP